MSLNPTLSKLYIKFFDDLEKSETPIIRFVGIEYRFLFPETDEDTNILQIYNINEKFICV